MFKRIAQKLKEMIPSGRPAVDPAQFGDPVAVETSWTPVSLAPRFIAGFARGNEPGETVSTVFPVRGTNRKTVETDHRPSLWYEEGP